MEVPWKPPKYPFLVRGGGEIWREKTPSTSIRSEVITNRKTDKIILEYILVG